MKKRGYLGLIIALVFVLCACTGINPENSNTTLSTYDSPTAGTTAEATSETTQPETETTAPAHSALYQPQYTPQQIWEYFEEVVLHTEYSDGTGNPVLVQKWLAPIRYRIYGDATEADLKILADLFAQLNQVPGFPGIEAAAPAEAENLKINFMDPESLRIAFSEILQGEDAFGATQFWYHTDTNDIHSANIGYLTTLDQSTRSSILIEEIINTLGITDTVLRADSIVYQYSDDNTALSDVDWLILKLLYDPAVQCGMDSANCKTVIEKLYY